MKKIALHILFLLTCFTLNAQVTIIVDGIPANTEKDAPIFISGSFEDWTGGQEAYQLTKKDDSYSITINKQEDALLYKFTQGTWQTVESTQKGESTDNRVYNFGADNDTIRVQIAGWSHLASPDDGSSAAKNVSILSEEFTIPQLNTTRTVRLYLPPGYTKTTTSYPVIYMHDGQNLFDKETAYSGEWNVDEALNQLYEKENLRVIVVAIDNGGKKRLDEYSPWENTSYGGGQGDEYIDFIVNTLKPIIDKQFRTLPDKQNTAIIGSSMGGLISHYAALQHPNVFGKVGVFSPAFWFAEPQVLNLTEKNGNISDTKIFFLAGAKEGEDNTHFSEIKTTAESMNEVIKILKQQQFPAENIKSVVDPEGKHNEELWRNHFEETILWLFKDSANKRKFQSVNITDGKVDLKVSDGNYIIQFYSPHVIETTFIPQGQKHNEKSHATIKTASTNKLYVKDEKANEFEVFSGLIKINCANPPCAPGISVKVQKEPFKLTYFYNGKKLTAEQNGYQQNDEFETLQFSLTDKEALYGGGARALGMNRRGNRLRLYNRAHYGYEEHSKLMNFTIPMVLSSKKYAIHFDNAPIGYLDLDSKNNNLLRYETISGRKTYQIIAGNSWANIIDNYTDLTGKQPMLPRWALGNFSSRFGYHTQQETEETITKFKEEKIPVDAVILDLYWFGKTLKGTMGNLEVDQDSFPNMKKMIADFDKQGVKTILITEPFILSKSKKWNDAVKADVLAKDSLGKPAQYEFYFGNTGLVDIYKPEGEAWFWDIYKNIKSLGVQGFWGDLGEPEVHPSWVKHATGSADEVHNIYGHDWARLIYQGYEREYPTERPFILMRAGYSGSQRYGMVPWSGDVNRSWGGLQSQPEIALQMGMQGLAYMHSDLGGFAGANLDDELYTRWLQYGVFQPIFRPHAQEEVPSEPVFRSTKAKDLATQAIELRYRMLPYNYQLMFENNQHGTPLMRPLFFDENNDDLLAYSDAYLWGHDFLVSPVLEQEKTEQNIYFPKESNWYNFYTDEKIQGGQTKTIPLVEHSIPTFVRGGAIIPMAKPMQNTDEYNASQWQIHFYYDADVIYHSHSFYNDNGYTKNAYKNGQYEQVKFSTYLKKKSIKIILQQEKGAKYATNQKEYDFVIHNIKKLPKRVKISGQKVEFKWNENTHQLTFKTDWNPTIAQQINIKL